MYENEYAPHAFFANQGDFFLFDQKKRGGLVLDMGPTKLLLSFLTDNATKGWKD